MNARVKPLSTCARCGAGIGMAGDRCAAQPSVEPTALESLRCRDRELANLHSLLRSVTISLEQAGGYCEAGMPAEAGKVIDSVLERLA